MRTIIRCTALLFVVGTAGTNSTFGQQQDTSSYFPLGLWGIWIDKDQAPYKPGLSVDWTIEVDNWTAIKANYLVYWMPDSLEEEIMNRTESLGYRLDISRWQGHKILYNYKPDTSLRSWILDSSQVPLTDAWKAKANAKIDGIKQLFGSRQGFYSYFLLHEADLLQNQQKNINNYPPDTLYWPALRYIVDRIAQVDPQHKSYVVHWGSRGNSPFAYGVTLSQFAQRFPNLGIYQVDDYVFQAEYSANYSNQQARLDVLLSSYNDCMNAFRNSKTEWHAIIQAQREYADNSGNMRNRRPNFYELRVQAYLALSRGARGITAFVYGSSPLPPPALSSPAYRYANSLLSTNTSSSSTIIYYQGLVQTDRTQYTSQFDAEGIPGFSNLANLFDELKLIGPTIRKLKNYSAFRNDAILANNSANIFSVSGDKIEIGTFKRVDRGTDSTSYFMLVNRVCNNADGSVSSPQNVTVVIRGGKYWIVDQATGQAQMGTYDPGTNRSTFTVTLEPGRGRLYELNPAVWSGTKNVTYNFTVPSVATLTVNAGTSVNVTSGNSITVNGVLTANGTSTQHISFTRSGASNWPEIILNSANGSSFQYCDISYASMPIKATNTSNLTIDNVTIGNSNFYNGSDNARWRSTILRPPSPMSPSTANRTPGTVSASHKAPPVSSNTAPSRTLARAMGLSSKGTPVR